MTLVASASASSNVVRAPFKVAPQAGGHNGTVSRQWANRPGDQRFLSLSDLKAAAKTLNLPFVVLAQLSRANEQRDDKRPSLSDLRDSGAIEQDADIVMFLHREHYYLARNPPKRRTGDSDEDFALRVSIHESDCAEHAGKAELNIAKNRNGGLGLVDLAFTDHLTRFSDLRRGDER